MMYAIALLKIGETQLIFSVERSGDEAKLISDIKKRDVLIRHENQSDKRVVWTGDFILTIRYEVPEDSCQGWFF